MNLAELERYFARVATSTSGPPEDLAEVFKDSPRLSARELMRIYNRGYHYRLLGVLASVFERTRAALGASEFERLGLWYLAQNPSQHPAVERVGRRFAEFLSEAPTLDRAIVDLARLEWARLRALVAADGSHVAASALDAARFPAQTLRFVPAFVPLELSVGALARFATDGIDAPEPGHDEQRGVVVYRRRHAVVHQVVSAEEFTAIMLAEAGQTMSGTCAAFDTGREAEDIGRAFAAISGWFERGWIAEVAPRP